MVLEARRNVEIEYAPGKWNFLRVELSWAGTDCMVSGTAHSTGNLCNSLSSIDRVTGPHATCSCRCIASDRTIWMLYDRCSIHNLDRDDGVRFPPVSLLPSVAEKIARGDCRFFLVAPFTSATACCG